MAVSKDLYRRLPYCIRKYLSRSQSFCLLITVLMATALFIIFQMFGLTHHIDADDIIYQSSLSRQNKLPPIIGRTKTPKTTSTTTKSTKRTFPALVRRRPVISKVFGVPSTLLDQYRPDGDNQFRCIKSGLQIPFDWVNDDFCDCPEDGSDEPSTNACRKGTFHCNGNNQNEAVLVLPSNRVNDGICDCCDGSDEWQSIQILPPMSEQLQQALGKYRPPCPDICT